MCMRHMLTFQNSITSVSPYCFRPYRLKMQPHPILGNTPPTPKKQASVFAKGDRIKLRKTATDTTGCLGDPGYGWVGTISSVPGGGSSSVSTYCDTARSGSYPQLSGHYPNWTYKITDLMHEFEDVSSVI